MRHYTRLIAIALLSVSCFQFSGCIKPDIKPPVEVSTCNITHTRASGFNIVYDSYFTYNLKGDPLTITVSNPGTGNPNIVFLYDRYNRLTDYFGPYSRVDPANLPANFNFEFWYHYTYADQNPSSLPVADTLHTFARYDNGILIDFLPKQVENYTYDAQGRIIKVNSTVYTYDSNGNLVRPGITYDNKKNFRSTNRIWKFVDRDYSVNNHFIATSYNDKGLPTIIPNVNTNFLHRISNLDVIDYACSTTVE